MERHKQPKKRKPPKWKAKWDEQLAADREKSFAAAKKLNKSGYFEKKHYLLCDLILKIEKDAEEAGTPMEYEEVLKKAEKEFDK